MILKFKLDHLSQILGIKIQTNVCKRIRCFFSDFILILGNMVKWMNIVQFLSFLSFLPEGHYPPQNKKNEINK